nr:MAG TPA: hypothetical protein [Caudoviricetes sp.]
MRKRKEDNCSLFFMLKLFRRVASKLVENGTCAFGIGEV